MAVYEYLCPECGHQFDLMRPISESGKPAGCPNCGSEAQKLISSFGSKTGDSIQPAGEPLRRIEFDSLQQPPVSSDSAEEAKLLSASTHSSGTASPGGRSMVQISLMQMLENLASKVRSLELERRQAAATIRELQRERDEAIGKVHTLEREVGELASLVNLAGEKVEEILSIGADSEGSEPQAVGVPDKSMAPTNL